MAKKGIRLRHSNLLSIAPTGTIATLTNTSWSFEPEFALVYQRRILGGKVFWEMDSQLETKLKELNLDSPELRQELEKRGGIQEIKEIPQEIKNVFVYVLDIKPSDHLKMQAVI